MFAATGRAGEPLELPAATLQATGKPAPESIADLRAIQEQVREVVELSRPTVVAVQIGGSVGSGVIVSAEGLVLTAGHVAMKPGLPVTFFFADGTRARGVSLGLNHTIDSGMLRITDKGPWPFRPIAEAGGLSRGDWVVTLGQPNGYYRDRAPPVRLGRVLSADDEVIHSDCTLVGGDSGGPLFNLRGEVVGIHSRIARSITSNFHVPIAAYHAGWDRLLAGQKWGGRDEALLARGGEERPDERSTGTLPLLGLAGGVHKGAYRVTQVHPGMPAARAGLKRGDIVRAYDGEAFATVNELARMLLRSEPGSDVTLDIERDGQPLRIEVRLGRIAPGFPGGLRNPQG